MADNDIRRRVIQRATEDSWAEKIGSGPFRYADGGHNPFPAEYLAMNGPEVLADLARRSSESDPKLRRKWLRAVREYKRDRLGRFTSS